MTDSFIPSSMIRISDLEVRPFEVAERGRSDWASGDYVVVEVTGRTYGARLELPNGRLVEVADGDLVLGALGRRHATLAATGSWEAVGRDGAMHLLTTGGLLGRVTSHSSAIGPLPGVRYVGHVERDGGKVVMRAFGRRAENPGRTFEIPTVMLIGTSMSAGKTAAARIVVRRLVSMGRRVLGAKLTGAGRYRDVLTMRDSGAEEVFDFVDAGLPSSVCPPAEYRATVGGLLACMAGSEADVAVIEVGASPLEPYNGTTAVELLAESLRMTILCASDPYAVVGLQRAFGMPVELVTGIASNTRAGVELVERLSGVRCLNLREKETHPELDALLREQLEC